ncbi:MAG TPA: hypothetical protein VLV18_02400 [Terriglobales bacterium]|nr:hypothetical protein [Terriglobales bacterium]
MTSLTQGPRPAFSDLVELVQLTDTPNEARAAVTVYLKRFPGTCPTNRCSHDLESSPYLCKTYRSRWHTFKILRGDLVNSASDGYALSTDEICNILGRTGDPRKEGCRECKASNSNNRGKMDGLYCHGCGFFIDFGRKQIGYTQEWTVSDDSAAPSPSLWGKKCDTCGAPETKAKFADYFFCSETCMNVWILAHSSNPTV